jgi:hypothetical protein
MENYTAHSDRELELQVRMLKSLPDTVIGYSIMDNGRYGGVYAFPRNKDSENIHWPPNVVAAPPPENIPEGYEAYWAGEAWGVRQSTALVGVGTKTVPDPAVAARQAVDLRYLPCPDGIPVPNEFGVYPATVLNAEGTAFEWVYPSPMPDPGGDPIPSEWVVKSSEALQKAQARMLLKNET